MGEGLSFEPGVNITYDIIFMFILLFSTFLLFVTIFYGLPYLFKADKERQARGEKFWLKFFIKLFVALHPMAVLIGLPILLNFMSAFYLGFYLIVSIFDTSIDTNYVVYFSFIIIYILYLSIFMRKISK